jgi:hypothetical protein
MNMKKVITTVCICIAVILFCLLANLALDAFWQKAHHVQFVVADGFHSKFRIRQSQNGVRIKNEGGKYVYHIPSSGELEVDSVRPLSVISEETAQYESGVPIPVAPPSQLLNTTNNTLFDIGADSDGWFIWLIGTSEEYKQAQKD